MDGLLAPHAALPLAFWDSGPDSEERIGLGVGADADEAVDGDDGANPEEIAEAYAASAEWLARATETPPSDGDAFDLADDDPAEIAADSTSMISDASRLAAFGLEEQDEQDDPREDERD